MKAIITLRREDNSIIGTPEAREVSGPEAFPAIAIELDKLMSTNIDIATYQILGA